MSEIQRKDIISDEALQAPYELIKGFEQFLGVLNEVYKTASSASRKIGQSSSLPGVRKETEDLTLAQIELEKIQKQIATQQARNNEEYIKEQKALAAVKQEMKERIALGNQDAKTINAQNASLKQLEAALTKNIRAYALLENEEQRTSVAGQQLLAVITKQNSESIKLSERLGDNRKKIGDYAGGVLSAWQKINNLKKSNMELIAAQNKLAGSTIKDKEAFNQLNVAIQNNLTKIQQYNGIIVNAKQSTLSWIQSLFGAAGLIGGVYGVVLAIKSFITVNKDLEKSLSTLQALTGASTEDLKFYKTEAIGIGIETKRSAKDVVEAFKLIGGARPELLANKEALASVTHEAIILANASGIELKDAADALGGALNQLQLNASDAGRAINAYAAGAKEGAAEIPDINAAYKEFGAVLKINNGTLEQGVGLIEVLASRQIKGAEAGTALRNVLLALSAVDVLPRAAKAQMAKFGVDLKIVGDTSLNLGVRLRELGKISGDSSALVKVFGKENFVAGNIVLNNIGLFETLTEKVTGTSEAYRQAAVATDNFQGDLDKAASETSALAAEIGESTQGILRGIVQTYIKMVEVLRALPTFLKENQASFTSLSAAVIFYNRATIVSAASAIKQAAAIKLVEIREKAAIITTRAFYTTLAANPFGAILLTIAAVVAAIAIYDKTSARANYIQKETVAINTDLDVSLQAITEDRAKLNTSIEDYLKMSKAEQINLQVEVIYRRQQAEELLGVTLARIEDLKVQAEQLTLWQKVKANLFQLTGVFGAATAASQEFAKENGKVIDDEFADKIKTLQDEILKYKDFLTDTRKADAAESDRAAKAGKDDAYKLRKFRLEQAIKGHEEIRDLEKTGFEGRHKAEEEALKDRQKLAKLELIHDLEDTKLSVSGRQLANEKYNAAIAEADKKSTENHKKLNDEKEKSDQEYTTALLKSSIQANENILHYEKSTIDQRNQALIDIAADKQALLELNYEKEKKLAEGNSSDLKRIQLEYNNASLALAKELADGINKNYFNVFDEQYGKLIKNSQANANQELKILDEQFAAGGLSAAQYNGKRTQLEIETNKTMMKIGLDFLKDKLQNFKGSEEDRLKIAEEMANAEIALAQYTADEKLKYEQAYNQALQNLQQTAFSSAVTIGQNLTAAEVQRLDNKIAKLKENYDVEIAAAGDNENLKKAISERTAAREKKLQDEKRRAQRKQAIFEKALSLTQVAVHIAEGIAQAYAEYPYPIALGISALIAATGAIEAAAIISAPIPSYYAGTENHPGGLARVGEKGTETIVEPSGKIFFTPPTSTIMDLAPGSKVFTNEDTKRLAMAAFTKSDYSPLYNAKDNEIVQELRDIKRGLSANKQSSSHDFVRHHLTVLAAKKEQDNFVRWSRDMAMGKWY